MAHFSSFVIGAAVWQNFYLMLGEAAATLVGLMFVAVTFGSRMVKPETASMARSFLDPTYGHFVHVIFTACLLTIPTMTGPVLGGLLLVISVGRAARLFQIYAHMQEAKRVHDTVDLSDWIMGIVLPTLWYVLLAGTAIAFILGFTVAFSLLAAVTVGVLLNGIHSAWELLVWMALMQSREP